MLASGRAASTACASPRRAASLAGVYGGWGSKEMGQRLASSSVSAAADSLACSSSSSSCTQLQEGARDYALRQAIQSIALLARRGKLSLRKMQRQASSHWSPVMAMGLVMPVLPGGGITDLLSNRVFMTGFCAWFSAQFLKIFTKRYKKGVWDVMAMFEPGGMPSSHSSLCSGVTTAIALTQGFGSPMFAVCVAFSVIVMYDAMGVRRHAGKQAEVLNQMINELMDDHPVGDVKLKEVLGHTPRQVACGAILGVLVGLAFLSFM